MEDRRIRAVGQICGLVADLQMLVVSYVYGLWLVKEKYQDGPKKAGLKLW